MYSHLHRRLSESLLIVTALLGATSAHGQQKIPPQFPLPFPADAQDHPGRAWRVQKTMPGNWGDSRVTESVAKHVVIYARQRYALGNDIVKPEDVERANAEMYDFLANKYGNPSLVTAQWLSTGYGHFDSHADEAAGALLGMTLPGPSAQVRLPEDVSNWLKAQVDSMVALEKTDQGICAMIGQILAASAGAPPTGTVQSGTPAAGAAATGGPSAVTNTLLGISCQKLVPVIADAAKEAIDRIGISEAALRGETFDVKTADISLMIYAKRHPRPYVPKNIQVRSRNLSPAKP